MMNHQPEPSRAVSKDLQPSDIRDRMERAETFVVNLSCAWCHDCKDQNPHLGKFEEQLRRIGVNFYQLEVQKQHRNFLSEEHQILSEFLGAGVIEAVGRLRFPLTVLVVGGKVKAAEFEITTPEELENLVKGFDSKLSES